MEPSEKYAQPTVISRVAEPPFIKGMWFVFAGLLILLALFSGNARAFAAPVNSPRNIPKATPQDLSNIADKNDDISKVKTELLQMLENNGQNSRDTEKLLLKMKEFLLLITENKLEYLRVLDDRLNSIEKDLDNSKLLTAKEIAEIRSALNTDVAFYEKEKNKIATLKSWENAKTLGNEIQQYSDQTLPRLRGLSGLQILNDTILLANRTEKIRERLKKNLDEFFASNKDKKNSADSKAFDFNAAYSELQSSIDSAKKNIQAAKEIYLKLIRNSGEQSNDAKARESLRAAGEDLKNARDTSLEITTELMKKKQSSSERK